MNIKKAVIISSSIILIIANFLIVYSFKATPEAASIHAYSNIDNSTIYYNQMSIRSTSTKTFSRTNSEANNQSSLLWLSKTNYKPATTLDSVGSTSLVNKQTSILISAVGDCTLGTDDSKRFKYSFIDMFNKNNNDYSYFFRNVSEYFKQDNLTIANLETTLTDATVKYKKDFNFKGYPSFTNILLQGNVDVVNLANNHSFDYLQVGFNDTVSNLKKSDIDYFGFGNTLIKEVNGLQVGMLGYKCWDTSSKSLIKKDIVKLKERGADIIIVSFHWGTEKSYYPNVSQTTLGRSAIDNGADLVIGHHPHVIQGIENYRGKNIVYSLGNFSYGGKEVPYDFDTFIFQQKFIFEDKKLIDSTTNIIPCSISSIPKQNNYQPIPLEGLEAQRVLTKLENLSKKIKQPTTPSAIKE